MCDPVTATIAAVGAFATKKMVIDPMKDAQRAQQDAMRQQQEAMANQQAQFDQSFEQRPAPQQQVQQQEMAVQDARNRARRRRFATQGFQSTMLTGGQGVQGGAPTTAASLLGGGGGGQSGKTSLGA